jgi:hypothetical protein
MDGWVGEWMDGWMGGWTNGWMGGRMDGWVVFNSLSNHGVWVQYLFLGFCCILTTLFMALTLFIYWPSICIYLPLQVSTYLLTYLPTYLLTYRTYSLQVRPFTMCHTWMTIICSAWGWWMIASSTIKCRIINFLFLNMLHVENRFNSRIFWKICKFFAFTIYFSFKSFIFSRKKSQKQNKII